MRIEKLHQEHIHGVIALLERYQPRTRYAVPMVDPHSVRGLCLGAIVSKRHVGYVAIKDKVVGILVGVLEEIPWNVNFYFATDSLFVAEDGGAYLARRFMRWANKPRVLNVMMAEHAGPQTASRMYEAMGFTQVGTMWEMPLAKQARRAKAA